MKRYGVVLVGCGYMGAAHLDEIYFRDNIEIRGVVDVNPARAQEFMRRYGALSCAASYKEYLHDPETDIFIISMNEIFPTKGSSSIFSTIPKTYDASGMGFDQEDGFQRKSAASIWSARLREWNRYGYDALPTG